MSQSAPRPRTGRTEEGSGGQARLRAGEKARARGRGDARGDREAALCNGRWLITGTAQPGPPPRPRPGAGAGALEAGRTPPPRKAAGRRPGEGAARVGAVRAGARPGRAEAPQPSEGGRTWRRTRGTAGQRRPVSPRETCPGPRPRDEARWPGPSARVPIS